MGWALTAASQAEISLVLFHAAAETNLPIRLLILAETLVWLRDGCHRRLLAVGWRCLSIDPIAGWNALVFGSFSHLLVRRHVVLVILSGENEYTIAIPCNTSPSHRVLLVNSLIP